MVKHSVEEVESNAGEVLRNTWMISGDSHIIEPPNLWQERVPASLRDRAPKVIREEDGDWWYVDGSKTLSFAVLGIDPGHRFSQDATEYSAAGPFSSVPSAAYDPGTYLTENETDGIWGSVIYPSEGLIIFNAPASEILSASAHAYNDWLAEFCSHDPSRLKGVAMINLDDIPEACAELTRVRQMGLSGAMIATVPPEPDTYRDPRYDPFWATAQDLDVPLTLHVATARANPNAPAQSMELEEVVERIFVNEDHQVRQALADLIFAGVFERFPRLKVCAAEYQIGWIPFFLERMDNTYKYRRARPNWYRFKAGSLPSDFFHQSVFGSFQEDEIGIREREAIGVDCLLWGSDYPHRESTFPRSRAILAENLSTVPSEDIRKIVSSNAAMLYHFDVPTVSPDTP